MKDSKMEIVLIILTIFFILLALFLSEILHFEFMQSDALGYWNDSLNWQTPFHPFHVPGYPLLIALVRFLSLDILRPSLLMLGINFVAFLTSSWLIYRLLLLDRVSEKYASLGALLIGLWPFVGLVYAVNPIADQIAVALLLAGWYFFRRSRSWIGGIAIGLTMITHKSMWVFGFAVLFAFLLSQKQSLLSRHNIMLILFTCLPLLTLWISGAIYHQSVTWIVENNLEVEIASRGSLPILDGIIGTLTEGTVKSYVKLGIVIAMAVTAMYTLINGFMSLTHTGAYYVMAVSSCVILFLVSLNRYEIWAAVRFSRLLAPALMWCTYHSGRPRILLKLLNNSLGRLFIFGFLTLSQFAYAYYMAVEYYG